METKDKEEDDDNRWSVFNNPSGDMKKLGIQQTRPKSPTFNQCLTRVLMQKPQRKRQEYICKTASNLVKNITNLAHSLDAMWGEFTTTNRHGVITPPIRTLSEDMYEVMVPIKRPLRLDGFKVYQKGIDELPNYRCLIQVNNDLSVQETHLVKQEWKPLITKDGFLKPKKVLDWFNRGLSKARMVLLSENHNVDKLICSVGDDGTATLHATVTDFDGDELAICVFSVNIYPVVILDRLPVSLKLNAPLPCFGNYIQGQKEFRKLVLEDIANGKNVAFLDPKQEKSLSKTKRSLPNGGPSWRVNLSFTEYHVYSLIEKYCRGLNFRHVLVLLNIFKEEFPDELTVLNNDILVNVLFNVSQKHIDDIRDKQEWLFKVMETLVECLQQKFLPSFYLPRLNLLNVYGVSERECQKTSKALLVILESLKSKAKNLYKFVGHLEPLVKLPQTVTTNNTETKDANNNGNTEKDTKHLLVANDETDTPRAPSVEVAARRGSPGNQDTGRLETETDEENGDIVHDLERSRLRKSAERRVVFDEDSGITKPSKVGNRSDIY